MANDRRLKRFQAREDFRNYLEGWRTMLLTDPAPDPAWLLRSSVILQQKLKAKGVPKDWSNKIDAVLCEVANRPNLTSIQS